MSYKSLASIGLLFTVMAGGAAAQENESFECRSETEQQMNIEQLTRPVPAGQAVAFLLQLDQQSPMWERLRTASNEEIGALLNNVAVDGLSFDPDSAYRLNEQHIFEKIPHVIVHVCMDDLKWNIIEAAEILKKIDGVKYVTPDSTLEEIPVIVEPVTPAPGL